MLITLLYHDCVFNGSFLFLGKIVDAISAGNQNNIINMKSQNNNNNNNNRRL